MYNLNTAHNPQQTSPRTLTDLAYGKLRDDIIRGEFQPGSKLRIEFLKQRYEMGATPLREALSRLSENGFVTAEGQRGFKVSKISIEDLEDITRLRIELENIALQESILTGGDEWEAQVIASFHQLAKIETSEEPDFLQWEQRNRQFHQALIGSCKSHWLKRFHEILYDQHKRYRNIGRLYRSPARDVHAEHNAICEAVLARNIERACSANEKHLRRTVDVVSKVLADKQIQPPETSRPTA